MDDNTHKKKRMLNIAAIILILLLAFFVVAEGEQSYDSMDSTQKGKFLNDLGIGTVGPDGSTSDMGGNPSGSVKVSGNTVTITGDVSLQAGKGLEKYNVVVEKGSVQALDYTGTLTVKGPCQINAANGRFSMSSGQVSMKNGNLECRGITLDEGSTVSGMPISGTGISITNVKGNDDPLVTFKTLDFAGQHFEAVGGEAAFQRGSVTSPEGGYIKFGENKVWGKLSFTIGSNTQDPGGLVVQPGSDGTSFRYSYNEGTPVSGTIKTLICTSQIPCDRAVEILKSTTGEYRYYTQINIGEKGSQALVQTGIPQPVQTASTTQPVKPSSDTQCEPYGELRVNGRYVGSLNGC